jgi:DNA polymerase elongation subunit (family B)
MGKVATQGLYYLLKKIGYNVLIFLVEDYNLYHLEFSNIIYGCEDKVKRIQKIKENNISEYVYDIETEHGRFNAGIGKMTIKNTDSIFIKFKYNRDDFERNRVDTFKMATLCGDNLTDIVFDRPPIVLEFEKVFNPFILLTKKRYIAKKYENMKDPFYLKGIDAKGIALTRRDYCLMVKKCYREIIDTIMDNSNKEVDVIERSLGVFRNYLEKIDKYDIEMDDLVISAQIGKEYSCKHCKQKTSWILKCENKNGSKVCNTLNPQGLEVCKKCKVKNKCVHSFSLAHINLAQRMLNRNDEVTVGDRLAYIYVENSNPKAAKNEMAEDPKYAVKNGLKLNRLCYLEQVAKPILGLYRVCLQHRQKELDDIIEFVNSRMVKYGGKKLKPSDYKIDDE